MWSSHHRTGTPPIHSLAQLRETRTQAHLLQESTQGSSEVVPSAEECDQGIQGT